MSDDQPIMDVRAYFEHLQKTLPLANAWMKEAQKHSVSHVLGAIGNMIGAQAKDKEQLGEFLNIIAMAAMAQQTYGAKVKPETETKQ